MSKAFDRVYHDGLIHKLQCMGIEGNLLQWLTSYLFNRRQRVVINGQSSQWKDTNAGVPQGSILGPLLFLIYVNDIVDDLESSPCLFADDTSLLEVISDVQTSFDKLNRDLARLADWANQWRVTFNATKTVHMVISKKLTRPKYPDLLLNDQTIERVTSHTHLGLTLTDYLTWGAHIDRICTSAGKSINMLKRLCHKIPRETKVRIYKTFIRPKLEYADAVFDACSDNFSKQLESVQRQAALACSRAYRCTSHTALLKELGLEPLATRRKYHKMALLYKMVKKLVPDYLSNLVPAQVSDVVRYNLRHGNNLIPPRISKVFHSVQYQNLECIRCRN